ncbi:EamA family transporter RarD [Cryobacterium breve]|uniref:EamA family transporter RarD n=1 Tax=Cryobacterium breve TaxID=1259258 RepID=UPI003D7C1E5A
MSRTPRQPAEPTSGLAFAISAYGLWGLLPLFFLLLHPTGPFEVVAWRVLFSLVFCLALITATRGWPALLVVLRRPKTVWVMGLAGLLIFVNWQTYVFAALTGHVVEAALGYFMNPIVTVLLGVFVLHERLRRIQWIAVAISVAAVLVLTLGYGSLPWISLVLALSFGFYGLIKKNVGPGVGALTGLTLETAWLMPIAIAEPPDRGRRDGAHLRHCIAVAHRRPRIDGRRDGRPAVVLRRGRPTPAAQRARPRAVHRSGAAVPRRRLPPRRAHAARTLGRLRTRLGRARDPHGRHGRHRTRPAASIPRTPLTGDTLEGLHL